MVSQIVRLPSPARAIFHGSRTMRPILKRPTPLPLSPAAQIASFSSLLSPSSHRAIKSPAPHVRFPSSPSLAATVTTYASDAYDRVPISISPNPVALPGWAPKVFRPLSLAPQPSPLMAEFEDPRSPRVQPAGDVTGAKAASAIRFAKMATTQGTPPARRIQDLEKALAPYPRSPYPSAMTNGGDAKMGNKGKQPPHTANEILETALGFSLVKIGSNFASPLGQSFALHTSSIHRSKKPAPLALGSDSADSDKLSNAFWNSVSIESANEPMVTALEYPESAVEYEEKMDICLRSASQPPLMFANAEGVLFSPGLPKPHFRVERLRETIQQVMSPSVKRSSFVPIARKEVTAPSPNDPFAAFPSFGAVLERVGVESPIQYPAPVAQMG